MKKMPILIALAYIFIVVGMVLIFARLTLNRSAGQQENAYGLVNTCVLSVEPVQRAHTNIENCYLKVEKKYGLNLERFYPEQ